MTENKILVIEDENPLREEIIETLQFEGFSVVGAQNGIEGVAAALDERPDLIICDITMPELDGYGVLLKLREVPQTQSVPFIFLTARAERSFVRHGMELGADDYVTKPFSRAELLTAVKSRLERHEQIISAHAHALDEAGYKLARLVVHELRQPVTAIRLVKDIISRQLEHLSATEVEDLLGTLASGTVRLSRVIEQIVYFTQLQFGLLTPQSVRDTGKTIQLWDVMPAVMNLSRQFASRNQSGSVHVKEQHPETRFTVSIGAFQHAMAEFICHTLNLTPEDETIQLESACVADHLHISIALPPLTEDTLRETADAMNPARALEGTPSKSLGLIIARQIFEIHGGSAVYDGNAFLLQLPASSHS